MFVFSLVQLRLMQNKTVLVTGAAGFVASHLVDQLLNLDAKVVGVDNLITGKKANLVSALSKSNFQLIEADVIQEPSSYLQVIGLAKFDLIFHLASPASPPRYQEHPRETYRVNSLGTDRLLQFLLQTNPAGKFIYASSSEIYGEPLEHPQKESYWGNVNPNGLRSCYDEGKRLGETICGVYSRDFGLDVRIARIFNTYGPRLDPDDGRVISNFIKQALASEKITIYGDGKQTRSYCYVSDLVAGLIALALKPEAKDKTVNLGNPGEYTVEQTAQLVFQAVNRTEAKAELIYQPLPADDPTRRQPDISLAQTLLGWQPQIPFEEGLLKTIEWFRQKSA